MCAHVCSLDAEESRKESQTLGAGITGGCKCWEPDLGPLKSSEFYSLPSHHYPLG